MLSATLSNGMSRVAIPQLGEMVAPRFEAASSFVIVTTEGSRIISKESVTCPGTEGFRRFRMLNIHQVSVLICNGIKGSYKDMLISSGVTVIDKVSSEVDRALQGFLSGALRPQEGPIEDLPEPCTVPHEKLVRSARMLFQKHGFAVSPGPAQGSFLVDLVAEMICPRCRRPVRVAICCGAHTYSANKEITEFHLATQSGYHARVYVCPARPSLLTCCREFGIELVDPDQTGLESKPDKTERIPLLKGAVHEHEQASGWLPDGGEQPDL